MLPARLTSLRWQSGIGHVVTWFASTERSFRSNSESIASMYFSSCMPTMTVAVLMRLRGRLDLSRLSSSAAFLSLADALEADEEPACGDLDDDCFTLVFLAVGVVAVAAVAVADDDDEEEEEEEDLVELCLARCSSLIMSAVLRLGSGHSGSTICSRVRLPVRYATT